MNYLIEIYKAKREQNYDYGKFIDCLIKMDKYETFVKPKDIETNGEFQKQWKNFVEAIIKNKKPMK